MSIRPLFQGLFSSILLLAAAGSAPAATFTCQGTTDSVFIRAGGTLNMVLRLNASTTRSFVLCPLEIPNGHIGISKSTCEGISRELMTAHAARLPVQLRITTENFPAGTVINGTGTQCTDLPDLTNLGVAAVAVAPMTIFSVLAPQ